MIHAVRALGLLIGIMLLVAFAACAAPPTLRPTASPTLTSAPTPIPFTPTLPPITPPPTLRRATVTPIPPAAPQPTPRPHEFDDVDAHALLSALFPDLKLTPDADAFRVNDDPDWTMWIGSRAEGRFTQDGTPELAAIIANDAPRLSVEQANRYAPVGSFLAIFRQRESKFQVVQRAFLFPTMISPQAFEAQIDRVTDFDRDGQDELLISTLSETLGVSTAAAFLYMWNDQTFVPIWSATIAEDNTGALNQSEYYAIESEIRFADVDGDGMDEIIVDSVRIDYTRDAQGLADTDHETRRRSYRDIYQWGGTAFVLDPVRATPMPK